MGLLEIIKGTIAISTLKVLRYLYVNGIEQNVLPVWNATGAPLTKGTLVYVSGYDAPSGLLKAAKADADVVSATFVVLEDIANASSGNVAAEALISNIDTSGVAAAGDPVYLSITAGGWAATAPTGADQLKQEVGRCLVKHATAGIIRFYPERGLTRASGSSCLQAQSVIKTKLAGGFSKVTLAAGTASGADVTVAGMAVGDELVSVLSFATAASIATVADRTSEYVVAAGKLTKSAGTNETSNQLVIIWNDLT